METLQNLCNKNTFIHVIVLKWKIFLKHWIHGRALFNFYFPRLMHPLGRVSQPWHYWYLGPDNPCRGGRPVHVGCLAAPLASTDEMQLTTPKSPDVDKCLLENKITLLRTTASEWVRTLGLEKHSIEPGSSLDSAVSWLCNLVIEVHWGSRKAPVLADAQTLRQRCACSQARPVRHEGSRNGQKEKVNCNATATETAASQSGAPELGWLFRADPNWGKGIGPFHPHTN